MSEKFSKHFQDLSEATLFDHSATMYPSVLFGVGASGKCLQNITSTFFGFIYKGSFNFSYNSKFSAELSAGMFFCCPRGFELNGKGSAMVVERFGYHGLFQIGFLEEDSGRLCYIDNASTTILVPPPRVGDPVFNFLAFPPNTVQSMHIHPTIRLGMIIGGRGECVTGNRKSLALYPGLAFNLPERMPHSFNSFEEGLKIIAFHPDSDVGPTDSSHPMLSRTYVVK
jgi:hypothetical protein